MSTRSKCTWVASIAVGGILLILALIGGSWQMSYAANEGVEVAPVIDYIKPSSLPAGSPTWTVVIYGSNFGDPEDFIRVWITDTLHASYLATPKVVIDNGISVAITDTLLVNPHEYYIAVIKSNGHSVPPAPPDPRYDLVSNWVKFTVYQPRFNYLPLVHR
jgi:hypothetical protein